MPLRVDPRQQARLRSAPILPTLPPEPSLEQAYTGEKTSGLTRVFQTYDRARREWSTKVGQHLGRVQDALLKLSAERAQSVIYPNRGWVKYIQPSDGFGGTGDSSVTYRPDSALVTIVPYWADGFDLSVERTQAAVSGDAPPSDTSVLTGVLVSVTRDSTEDLPIGRGILRVTLTPTFNTDRGTNPGDQVRLLHSYYSFEDDWTQFHYFEPYSREDPYPNPVYWKDLDIASVYAELV